MLDPTLVSRSAWQTFYVITGSAAAALPRHPDLALDLLAAASLLLLFTGIRNGWDSAVYIAAKVR
jgi:hypothetical protein